MKRLLLFTFFALFFALIYLILFPIVVTDDKGATRDIVGALRGYTPTFAALLTILCTRKSPRFKDFWKNAFRLKTNKYAYLAVILIPLLINVLVVVSTILITDIPYSFAKLSVPKFLAIYFIFIFLDGPLGEELGWRGYFLPELLSRFNPVISSLIIGIVQFLWHVLIFAADGPILDTYFLVKYFISILGISVIFTFVYLRFSKLPIIAVLLHTSVNYFIFFRNSLIPEMKNTSIDSISYVVIVTFIAIASIVLLIRKSTNHKTYN